jgi:drug/metabolite transporter (DMT)-like permease
LTEVKLTDAITADTSRNELLKIAIGGLVSGVLTPLLPAVLDRLDVRPGMWQLAVVALPFAVLVFVVLRWRSAGPAWAAIVAAIVTMIAFVAAVNAAVYIDGQMAGAAKAMRSLFAGLAGGLVGSALMALGIAMLPAGPRKAAPWMPMLVTGTVAGSLLALDNSLGLDRTSFLYPVWQAAVAVRLAMVLRR